MDDWDEGSHKRAGNGQFGSGGGSSGGGEGKATSSEEHKDLASHHKWQASTARGAAVGAKYLDESPEDEATHMAAAKLHQQAKNAHLKASRDPSHSARAHALSAKANDAEAVSEATEKRAGAARSAMYAQQEKDGTLPKHTALTPMHPPSGTFVDNLNDFANQAKRK